ncbi:MAG: bacillithiol biosynthesis BshC, partial [Saprospiraceae bacterium]|nr:bacillithiol biosynthesis BshC [Saprospiraceae bacterium]
KFEPYMRRELLEQASRQLVETTATALEAAGFSGQAHARNINLFYMRENLRERIVEEGGRYTVLHTDFSFTKDELLEELAQHPDRFSPNVILRPLYQECILPNLAYVGGGGEIAYWLERKSQFAYFGLNFPMLVRRNSALWIDKNTGKRIDKLGLRAEDLLEDTEGLIRRYVQAHAGAELSLAEEKKTLEETFRSIGLKATNIDPTLEKTVLAETAKQLKSLEQLEERLLRAEKQRHEVAVNQLRALRDKLFPGNGLQERHDNLLPYFLTYGWDFFHVLKEHLHPLEPGLVVISE